MIEAGAVLKRCADTRYRNIGGEGVVVRQTAGEVLVLNEVGVRVLELLEGIMPVSGLLDALNAEYDIDRPTLERDVLAYLQELVAAGVIEHVAV
jgi:hypothetical protein